MATVGQLAQFCVASVACVGDRIIVFDGRAKSTVARALRNLFFGPTSSPCRGGPLLTGGSNSHASPQDTGCFRKNVLEIIRAPKESLFSRATHPRRAAGGAGNCVRRSLLEFRLFAKGHFMNLHPPTPASLRGGTLLAWENSPELARRWSSSIASWVRY